ncbi:hypothetical protein BGZ60DRAFT_479512 [Tricladium varicosporioides]|nr:hypothetical protein BGZ60DRAFT_479512 [Hymenoscyphus varicosporioides]
MFYFLLGIHLLQACFGAYHLCLAAISIHNLQGYEPKVKQAAKYSNFIENNLNRTRMTQASSFGSLLVSTISSFYTLFSKNSLLSRELLALINIGGLLAAHEHVGNFWRRKKKMPLPGTGDYNEAIGKTREARMGMVILAVSWGVSALLILMN